MFGRYAVWKVVLVSSLTISVMNLFGEVLFEFAANYLRGVIGGEETIQVSCVTYGIPASFSEAVELAQFMSEEKVACMREYFVQEVQENVEL